jgi:haloacetate dehalogenase
MLDIESATACGWRAPRRAGRCRLLLLHGHPQTHAMWHRVAPLAERFELVLMDLRGYGDSGRPAAGEGSAAYSKREMAPTRCT